MSDSDGSASGSFSNASEAELGAVNTLTDPYQDEPLALGCHVGQEEGHEAHHNEDEEGDEDGIPLRTIEQIYDRIETVDEWYVQNEPFNTILLAHTL